ncbi:MAG: response regulator [Thermodesulfobacteriota bacterium]|nr:response regulator [Thermodesulfobacteriota bacterium]
MTTYLEIQKILKRNSVQKDLYGKTLEETNYMLMEKIQELSLLRRISDASRVSHNLKGVCKQILESIIEETNVDNASIMLFDNEKRKLSLIAAIGREDTKKGGGIYDLNNPFKSLDFYEGEGVAGWVLKHGKPLLVNDTKKDSKFKKGSKFDDKIGSLFCLPMEVRKKIIGVINLSHSETGVFSTNKVNFLLIIANQVALELDNVLNYCQLKQLNQELERRIKERTRELEKVNRTLVEAKERLIQTERLKALGHLSSGIAHDFNNLLAAILGNIQLLIRETEDEDIAKRLYYVEEIVNDGVETVAKIQEFSKLRKAKKFIPIDVGKLIRDVVALTKPRWKDKVQSVGLKIDIDIKVSEGIFVMGDLPELRRTFMNFILNAVDAMPRGGKISIRTKSHNGSVRIYIKDSGIGVRREDYQKIFDPFFTTKGKGHSGLGLSVAEGVIQRHGGGLRFESKAGEGTTFIVRLPLTKVVQKCKDEKKPALVSVPDQNTKGLHASILIIDDDESIQKILRDILKMDDHIIYIASNGKEGIDLFRKRRFDLVITDLGMPGMSGWKVAEEIKKIDQATPVILNTGWGGEIDEHSLKEKGIDFLLTKPFNFDAITQMVSEVVSRKVHVPKV